MKNCVSFLLLFIVIQETCAQKEANIWHFGNHYSLDFNYNPPVRFYNSNLYSEAGSSSMSDSNGELLFYTQGDTVWNRDHEIMKNGIGLGGKKTSFSPSAAIILKQPLSNRYYYVFTSDSRLYINANPPYISDDGNCYSIIDIEADENRGKVIQKKQLLVKNSADKIASVLHANKKDYWIAIKQNFSDTLFMFLLTEKGISSIIKKNITYRDSGATGQMKFSPNGKYLAMGNIVNKTNDIFTYLYDFNNNTGITNKQRKINSYGNGLEFSPNSKYIYISPPISYRGLYQCRINTITDLFTPDSINCYYIRSEPFHAMQLATNGKIYGNNSDSFLGVINFPNVGGVNCNYEDDGQKTIKDHSYFYPTIGLPSFVASYFRSPVFIFNSRCLYQTTNFLLLDSLDNDSVKWDFGDTASKEKNYSSQLRDVNHTYTQYGSYMVSLVIYYDNRADTVRGLVHFLNPKPDFTTKDICDKDTVHFTNTSSSSVGQMTFNWKFGDGNTSILPSASHLYTIDNVTRTFNVTLTATLANGCSDSITKSVTVNANPDSDFTFSVTNKTVDFNAIQAGNSIYVWKFGNGDSANIKDILYTYKTPGSYKVCLLVKNAADCFSNTCKDILLSADVKLFSKNTGFIFYPSPNKGILTLEIEQPNNDLSIEIYDLLGQLIYSSKTFDRKSVYTIDLTHSFASKGALLSVRVISNGCIQHQKLMVLAND